MKNVTVTVQIQFDVFSNDGDQIREEVREALAAMNSTLEQQHGDRTPVIFTLGINNSDIEIHGMCQKYPDSEALPDEDGSCSLCGGDCAD